MFLGMEEHVGQWGFVFVLSKVIMCSVLDTEVSTSKQIILKNGFRLESLECERYQTKSFNS